MSVLGRVLGPIVARWQGAGWVRRVLWALLAVLLAAGLIFSLRVAMELVAASAYPAGAAGQNGLKNVDETQVERGRYLATLGNCAACHTERGGAAYAGGKAIATPFGAVFAGNITPDAAHGIGTWSADAFYRALHQGVNAQGRLLTPAFPYPNFTQVSRADSDALYAYFMQAVPPVAQPNRSHELRWPFNTQWALAVWRVLFFTKADHQDAINSVAASAYPAGAAGQNGAEKSTQITAETALITRGQYLVQGLGHCSACHAQRNAFGAARDDGLLAGSLMPMQDWYAPSLHAKDEAGVQHWPRAQVVALLQTGVAANASALGPMAEVVSRSTQHWREADLQAAAAYLQSLPVHATERSSAATQSRPLLAQGAALYAKHCATCHGEQGQGLQVEGHVALPALAGNRAVTMSRPVNLVRIILAGGYAPSTAGNPLPYGMPPFVHVLPDEDIAAVATFIRASWGNAASAVSGTDVVTVRRGVLR